jgi:hypothetical protein
MKMMMIIDKNIRGFCEIERGIRMEQVGELHAE